VVELMSSFSSELEEIEVMVQSSLSVDFKDLQHII
jgi:hypothetical protein